ncbi:MAG: hypothetical protein GW906_06315 [Epsilonproteobacteria bacterium]|nr:hypothetical protein [Campylobacterota bacterium]OIO17814.1 MAG: hypothetical protein AUJ81_01060 [Helicobacteraceae bacterium CG1_02_36_14]PIP10512.1 MAG: hypothetical protein COX50_05290 [Sulfurimonas sp. CG23_combo_of_CG06-09_8_20_14_all_36_33]PIS26962.1 MAG: hypothetical protein COT46_00565 [Sulfurimonas sp. CG08_land_8_20_14_0_20_36_33]PIU35856.1 MAG: hypothetical protein COT05_01540 [Sulfurimonas sp. CG07_land_8_20_14_0_80_36_56]PIV03433.1 MAG: hypothetical protein COS56_08395 [Sulfur
MPKFKIRETFANGSSHSLYIPAGDEATALSVASALLDGELEVLQAPIDIPATAPSPTNVSYKRFDVMGKNIATGSKTYLSFLGKTTVTDLDVQAFLLNKTINTVKFDEVTVSVRSYVI